MMDCFSANTINQLGYYVYVYSDPNTHIPFYIGKGKENRAFNHLHDKTESDKVNKIKEILNNNKHPIIEILVHGVDEETAFKVEAAAIDLIGISNLTNIQSGHHSSTYGKIEASSLEARYSCIELSEEDITDNIMMIKITQNYYNGISPIDLYDVTRRSWKINKAHANKIAYVCSVYDGIIIEVYKVAEWLNAYSTMSANHDKQDVNNLPEKFSTRYEFVGNIAIDDIRSKYINKSVSNLFIKGSQNPIKYFIKDQK